MGVVAVEPVVVASSVMIIVSLLLLGPLRMILKCVPIVGRLCVLRVVGFFVRRVVFVGFV